MVDFLLLILKHHEKKMLSIKKQMHKKHMLSTYLRWLVKKDSGIDFFDVDVEMKNAQ